MSEQRVSSDEVAGMLQDRQIVCHKRVGLALADLLAALRELEEAKAEIERLTRSCAGWEADALREKQNADFHRAAREQAERERAEAIETLQVMLAAIEDEPMAVQFFDLRVVARARKLAAAKEPKP